MLSIIYNPFSGRKKRKTKKINEVFEFLKKNSIEYKLYKTEYANHPYEIAKEITSNETSGTIVIIGGDGTINEVISGVVDLRNWKIGIIAIGSGNDFAKALNLPIKKPIEALNIILKNEVKKVDYVVSNDKIFINILGTGIDVEVLKNFEKHKKLHGGFRYFISLVEALIKLKWYDFEVSIDDGEFIKKNGIVMAICNGVCYGGGIRISPLSSPIDGKLDFVFIGKMKKIKVFLFLFKLMVGKVTKIKQYERISCKKIIVKCQNDTTLQLDGNIMSGQDTYTCEIVEGGLNIIT